MFWGAILEQSMLYSRWKDDTEGKHRNNILAQLKLAWQRREPEKGLCHHDLEAGRGKFLTESTTPFIYICVTVWHETRNEMMQMLKSIFRVDWDQSTRKKAQRLSNTQDPAYYEFEAHIFFDDAFLVNSDNEMDSRVNGFVKAFIDTMDTAASAVHKTVVRIPPPKVTETPYGGRLEWVLPGGNTITAHLKDKTKIRQGKRWSQVMYMYYCLDHRLPTHDTVYATSKSKRKRAEQTYLLTLDGDVDFQPESVSILVDCMRHTPGLGAACGRIHPIGTGPMVWVQKFEYAVSHWLYKATEHVLGCVLCSPGCFSLLRGSCLMEGDNDKVMESYSTPATRPIDYVQYDQGEDRWLSTLLLQQGYKIEYCAASDCSTFVPEDIEEFFNQRRRWIPSTMVNVLDVIQNWKQVTRTNPDISILYIGYQLFMFLIGILTPGTSFLLLVHALHAVYPAVNTSWCIVLNAVPIAAYVFLCYKTSPKTQVKFGAILSVMYSLLMILMLMGVVHQTASLGFCSVHTLLTVAVVGILLVTAFLHPREWTCSIYGLLYYISIPSMTILLTIYSIVNLHVVSWGTREYKQHNTTTTTTTTTTTATTTATTSTTTTTNNNNIAITIENPVRSSKRRTAHADLSNTGPAVEDNTLIQRNEKNKDTELSWTRDPDIGRGVITGLEPHESQFWNDLIDTYLIPLERDERKQSKLEEDLIELRNKMSLRFFAINVLFILLMYILQTVSALSTSNFSNKLPCAVSGDVDVSDQTDPISLSLTLVFVTVLFLQFLSMLVHRYYTLQHIQGLHRRQRRCRSLRAPNQRIVLY